MIENASVPPETGVASLLVGRAGKPGFAVGRTEGRSGLGSQTTAQRGLVVQKLTTLLAIALASMPSANATDAIPGGYVTNLTYKDAYFVFQLRDKGSNSCAACPKDPVGLHSGGYCWVSATIRAEVSLLIEAEVHHLMVSGRVESSGSNCAVYQMSLQNTE